MKCKVLRGEDVLRYIKKCIKRYILLASSVVISFNKYTKVDKNKIMFISFHGRGDSDNPKAIYNELIKDKRFEKYEFIWALKDTDSKKFENIRTKKVRYRSLKYFYYLGICKYWVFNCRMPEYVSKKKGQIYLQTWHGTPLKRLAHDVIVPENTTFFRSEMSFDEMTKAYDIDVAKYDYMISPNAFTTEVFQTSFKINEERLIETGYPRNDILSNATPCQIKQLKEKYGIPAGKKVLLYAPTWRDNSYVASGYTFELLVNFYKWKEELGDEYVVIFKPHYLISNKFDLTDLEGFVYSLPTTVDISELYLISDILITDYSSVFFDFAILNKPIYFYMYDLDEYQEELRGFYIDIHTEIPGDVYTDEGVMLTDIREERYDYSRLCEFNKRFNNMEDGNATQRVIDIVFKDI